MLLKLYSVKDNLKGELDNITPFPNDGLALRYFTNLILDPNAGLLFKNTGDFAIYSLGILDTATGIITPDVEFVVNCIDLKNSD